MFTPTTILKVMCMSGIIPEEIQFFDLYKYSRMFKKPFLGNTIVTVGRFGNKYSNVSSLLNSAKNPERSSSILIK